MNTNFVIVGNGSFITNIVSKVSIVSVVVTNWVTIPGDVKRETGTNYVHQEQVVITNRYFEEVKLCTNRVLYDFTLPITTSNTPRRWVVAPRDLAMPPMPNGVKP